MLKLSLFEGEQKCTDFVSVPLNANELLLPAGFNPLTVYGFNRLCPLHLTQTCTENFKNF